MMTFRRNTTMTKQRGGGGALLLLVVLLVAAVDRFDHMIITVMADENVPGTSPSLENLFKVPCSVCAGGEIMTNPDVIVPSTSSSTSLDWLESDISCLALERKAQQEAYTPIQCVEIRLSTVPKELCGCQIPPTRAPGPVGSSPTTTSVVTRAPVPAVPTAPVPTAPAPVPQPVVAPTAPVVVVGTEEPVVEETTAVPSIAPAVTVEEATESPVATATTEGPSSNNGAPTTTTTDGDGVEASGRILVQLSSLTEEMSSTIEEFYTREMAVFLNEFFKTLPDNVFTNISVTLANQTLLVTTDANNETDTNATSTSGTRRQLRWMTQQQQQQQRKLQDGNNETETGAPPNKVVEDKPKYPLDTVVDFVGMVPTVEDAEAIQGTLPTLAVELINTNEAVLMKSLQDGPTFTEIAYFQTLTSIMASDPLAVSVPEPTTPSAPSAPSAPAPTPSKDDDDGFSSAAIAGIAIAGLVLITLLINAYTNRNRKYQEAILAAPPPRLSSAAGGSNGTSGGVGGGGINALTKPSIAMPLEKATGTTPAASLAPSKASTVSSKPSQTSTAYPAAAASSSAPVRVASSDVRVLSNKEDEAEISIPAAREGEISIPAGKEDEAEIAIPAAGTADTVVSMGDDHSAYDQGTFVGGGGTTVTGYGDDGMSYAYSLDPAHGTGGTALSASGGSTMAPSAVSGGASAYSSGGASGTRSVDDTSSQAMSSLRQNMVSRTVVAPPGKLGIVIDTTLEGPVVHKINPQSPLEGSLFPGDIIVAIDDVDTRAMSASAITALMVRTANLRRKLTVLSEDVTS